ncbi:hypothetical protein KPP23_068 [Pseudomonas phage KPP23]|nr:hypothetical protein KPP23_068 [Pseudomonas phage KPP23]
MEKELTEKLTLALLGHETDNAPGSNWQCNRQWKIEDVRARVREVFGPVIRAATRYQFIRQTRNGFCVLSSFYNLDPEDWSVERIDGACLDGAIDGSVQRGEPLDLGALFPASAVRKTGAKSPDGRASFVLVSGPFDGSIILAPATADRFNVVCFTEDGEDAGRARMAQYSVHRRPSGEPFGTAVCTSLEYAPE